MIKQLFRHSYEPLNQVYISEDALVHNLETFRRLNPGKEICPVLKGNAYGHGITLIARLLDKQNCAYFIVDSLFEAYELKKAKIKTKILILGYNLPHNLRRGLPFVFTASDLASLKELTQKNLPFHLEIDTGMHRMGLSEAEVMEALPYLRAHSDLFRGIFTHFMSSYSADRKYFELQEHSFRRVLDKLGPEKPQWIHLGNSAGAQKTSIVEANMCRIGMGLYGVNVYDLDAPEFDLLSGLKQVMKVKSTLVAVHHLKAGDVLSYGASHRAEKDMTVGIIPFGYFEGMPRALSRKGILQYKEKSVPIVGNVNMNHTFLDLSGMDAAVGDKVIIFSDLFAEAERAGTIPYELCTRLSPSIRRSVTPST